MAQRPERVALGAFPEVRHAPSEPSGRPRPSTLRAAKDAVSALIDQSGGLAWVKPGDRVLLKVACNSPRSHPAVTSPLAVEATASLLRDAGARVFVADQGGVEHVRRTATHRRGATRDLMASNGIAAAARRSGASIVCFDDETFESWQPAHFEFTSPWGDQVLLAESVYASDHVVLLPRLSTHALTGYTGALKIHVGYLRDDQRRVLHQLAGTLFAKIADLAFLPPLRDRTRLVLTLSERALVDIGPDIGSVVDLEAPIGIAARTSDAHDRVLAALLPYIDDHHRSLFDLFDVHPKRSNFFNARLVERTWGRAAREAYEPLVPGHFRRGLLFDATLTRAAVVRGARPGELHLSSVGQPLPEAMLAAVRSYSNAPAASGVVSTPDPARAAGRGRRAARE